jgi:protein-ribulosamine 3-kinase
LLAPLSLVLDSQLLTLQTCADPELTPRPIAVGTYESDPKVHFFLCEFLDMTDELPDLHNFPAKLAKLHENSVSPTGQYGFGTPTCLGVGRPHYHKWTDTWEEFYLNFFLDVAAYEEEVQGPDEEMAELVKAMAEKVIPRLCRPLETGGRGIKPRLIHGDLWDGNASVVIETGLPVIFDACSMYTHNECK